MTDSNGKNIKDGDTIKTSRGVVLEVSEENGHFYMFNSGNGQKSSLEIINVDFYVLDDDAK